MRVAWFSPVAENQLVRSASFTRSVLPELPRAWEVEIFTSDADWVSVATELWEPMVAGAPVYPYQRAFLRHEEAPFDLFIFHLEDHPAASFVKAGMGVWPGIVFVHDLNLSRLEKSGVAHATTEELLNEKAREEFGARGGSVGDLAARGWSTEIFERLYPLGMSELRKAAVLVAPNERSVDELTNRFPRIPVERAEFPVRLFCDEEWRVHRDEARRTLELGSEEFVIFCVAQSAVEDRAYLTINAVAYQLKHRQQRSIRVVWLVTDRTAEQTIERLLLSHPDPDLRVRTTLVSISDVHTLQMLCCGADCMVHLKFDLLRGHTVFVHAALAAGLPLLMSDFGPSGEVNAALHVRVGRGEEQELQQLLDALISDPRFGQQIAEQMKEYCAVVHDPRSVADDIEAIARLHGERLRAECARAEERVRAAREATVSQFLAQLGTLSLSLPGENSIDPTALGRRLSEDFGWNS